MMSINKIVSGVIGGFIRVAFTLISIWIFIEIIKILTSSESVIFSIQTL